MDETAHPCHFRASGDLTARKLIPSLYHLASRRCLPDELRIVGVLAHAFSDDAYRDKLQRARQFRRFPFRGRAVEPFARRLFYALPMLPGQANWSRCNVVSAERRRKLRQRPALFYWRSVRNWCRPSSSGSARPA